LATELNVHSSYLSLDRDGLFSSAFFDDPEFYNKYVLERKTKRLHGLSVYNEITPLGFTMGLGKHGGLGISFRLRNHSNVASIDRELAEVIKRALDVPEFFDSILTSTSPKTSAHFFNELSFSYGRNVFSQGPHSLNVGLTPKFLLGNSAAYLQGNNLNYKIYEVGDSALYFDIHNATLQYGYSKNVDFNFENFQDFLRTQLSSSAYGIGLDIGATYEFSPKYETFLFEMDGQMKNKRWLTSYLFKTGFSLTDLGGIFYKNHPNSAKYELNRLGVPRKVFEEVDNYEGLSRVLDSLFQRKPIKESFFMNLPGMFHWFAEVQPLQRVLISVSTSLSLNPGKNDITKTRYWNSYGLSVRYEHPFFGIGLPAAFNTLSGFNAGIYLRLGPFNLGSPSLFSSLLAREIRSVSLFAGLSIPVPYGKPKDQDEDKVSNRRDKCKNTPGVWEFYGCPDVDGDHVQDSEDDCPLVAGLKVFRGCPDTDKDGVPDKDDQCPRDSGLVKFRGCPDRDNDEIIDKDDACPDQKGLAQFKGCPDT
ncbi:MAG: DUF5723 family protein, partial [Clostridia bacterium]|nr:DUF5723 family protein [Clostridia bacterium]